MRKSPWNDLAPNSPRHFDTGSSQRRTPDPPPPNTPTPCRASAATRAAATVRGEGRCPHAGATQKRTARGLRRSPLCGWHPVLLGAGAVASLASRRRRRASLITRAIAPLARHSRHHPPRARAASGCGCDAAGCRCCVCTTACTGCTQARAASCGPHGSEGDALCRTTKAECCAAGCSAGCGGDACRCATGCRCVGCASHGNAPCCASGACADNCGGTTASDGCACTSSCDCAGCATNAAGEGASGVPRGYAT